MALHPHSGNKVQSYNFTPGRILARKYEVVAQVGKGREGTGEIYMLKEGGTGIERTGRFFFPHLYPDNRVAAHYAQKLHKLRHCDILMQYRTAETISVAGTEVTFLVSDTIEGQFLREHLAARPFRRLSTFEGLHLLHALACGVEKVHRAGDFHGELRPDNIVVKRYGLGFKVKLLDMAPVAVAPRARFKADVDDLLAIFHETIGGLAQGGKVAYAVTEAALGFRDATDLKAHLENLAWSSR